MGRNTGNFDWITALILLFLSCFGLFLLLTIGFDVFLQQAAFLVTGFVIIYLASRLDSIILWWFAPFAYVLGNLFLLLSFLGPKIRGASRWIFLGPIQIQPSELCKPLFLLAFAYFITKYTPRKLANLPILMGLFLVPLILVFRQPDLGSSLVYGSFWVAMLLAGGLPVTVLLSIVALCALLLPAGWFALLPYQRNRILTFLNPGLDPKGAGYNALQAMIAVGSGQIFGRGLGRGTQSQLRFLPENHTDFIFASVIEELGFVGGILLLSGYAFLLIRIILPLFRGEQRDVGVFVYTLGFFSMLLSQIFINAGMNMGLIPITGITLPFVSSGGSSILSLSLAFGFLWALQRGKADSSTIAIR